MLLLDTKKSKKRASWRIPERDTSIGAIIYVSSALRGSIYLYVYYSVLTKTPSYKSEIYWMTNI
jgi:hypothetical protein